MTSENPSLNQPREKIGIGAYVSLILAIIFFSGLAAYPDWRGIFDFGTLNGGFGKVVASVSGSGDTMHTVMSNFRGKGGEGAIDGFVFAFTLVPTVMFALAMITIFEHYGALKAARVLLNPLLRPLMGLSGATSLALIASLQSTDGGAALTRQLKDAGELDDKELTIFATFQMTADAPITNFLSTAVILFALSADVPQVMGACLGIVLLGKVLAANIMRFGLYPLTK